LPEVFVRFAGKPDNNITGYGHSAARILDGPNSFQIITGSVTAAHRAQDSIATRLHRQMNPFTEVLILVDRRHDVRMKIARERGSELYPLHPGRRDCPQQTTEWRGPTETFQA